MSFFSMLYTLLFYPLELFFEVVFSISNRVLHPGLSIIVLSLVMNILALPLYRRADQLQVEEKDREAKLRPWINHIKKYFKGSERFMMLQTFYRENHYKPTDSLKGSISLLLEIPFFIAAYRFLSHVQLLNGVSFGPLTDLGTPDQLLTIFGYKINLLPLIMTAINIVASCIYLKGMPLKSKIQLYGVALIFLVLLYSSPSGLVFYWTLNNLFSLVKNIFYKLKNPRRVLASIFSILGVLLLAILVSSWPKIIGKLKIFSIMLVVGFQIPSLTYLFRSKFSQLSCRVKPVMRPQSINFLCPVIAFVILTGLLIPSALIQSSPEEFIDPALFINPLRYIFHAFTIAIGFFVIWLGIFYSLSSQFIRCCFEKILIGILVCSIINYMFWGTKFGIISPFLQYLTYPVTGRVTDCINLLILVFCFVGVMICIHFLKKNAYKVSLVLLFTILLMACFNIYKVQKVVSSVKNRYISMANEKTEQIHFPFTTKGKNVVVVMMDKAINSYIPYIFAEKPELKKKFAGFTYYPNTISFGQSTVYGAPSLYGGYEYIPEEMNKRAEELLKDKHDEALMVMPVLFDRAGAKVTVCDPSNAGYVASIPDLSIYKNFPRIKTYNTIGAFDGDPKIAFEKKKIIWHRNFFCNAIFRILPTFLQEQFYWAGSYSDPNSVGLQRGMGTSYAVGLDINFMKSYNVLKNLSNIVSVTEDSTDTFLMMSNNTAHDPMLLQRPNYIPALTVDNKKYDHDLNNRVVAGRRMKMDRYERVRSYHGNMAAMLCLAEWFDFLRSNNVYDNTRIIIVADHGWRIEQFENTFTDKFDMENYHPLLLVKDFNSKKLTVDHSFMTNADTPTLAMKGLISSPCNPFTGKQINSSFKTNNIIHVIGGTWNTNPDEKRQKQFVSEGWINIKRSQRDKNVFDLKNWGYSVHSLELDKGIPFRE